MAEQYKIIHPVKYYRNYLNHSIRPDGREFDKFRPIGINIGSINTADGSAIVTVGSTNVVCTIKAELAKPKAHEPDCGYIVPNVELLACSHAKYRAGDTKDAEVLTCTICNILENSDCIDLKQLCIHKDKLVWCLYCDITCLNHDGCVADAALIAILAALRNLTLPKIEYDADINKITTDISERKNIIIKTIPVATTLMAFDDNVMITDPTSEEEGLSSSLITIAICNSEVCFSFKAGGTPFSPEQMDLCIKQALLREKFVLKLLNEVFKKT